MRTFKDKSGQEWPLELTIGAVLRVKGETAGKVNLFEPQAADLAQTLHSDLAEFWETLWRLIAPAAAGRQVSAEQFGELMSGDCLLAAHIAFFDEWRDFFRRLQRPDKAAMLEKMALYHAKAIELAKARLDAQGPELDRRVEAKMQAALNDSFGNLLASVESTPDQSPSAISGT